MMNKKTLPSRLTKALLETADDMRRAGVMDAATHAKITLRHLGDKADVVTEPITGAEIRKLREQAHFSQAVFARYLNLTVGWSVVRSGRAVPRSCCSTSSAGRVSRRFCKGHLASPGDHPRRNMPRARARLGTRSSFLPARWPLFPFEKIGHAKRTRPTFAR